MSNEDTLRKGLEAFNQHNPQGFTAMYAEDAIVYDPFYPEPLRGKAAIRKDMEDFFAAFPDIQMHVANVIASGDTVAMEATGAGTHRGPMLVPGGEVPPTNRRMEIRGAIFCRFDAQGQITEERRYFDTGSIMQQLGLLG
ncbi:MAG TPA: ester cyclase [Dehalococcoidia bacterium]|nr:ester cyclase [Dehalococcoidia bacterium]